MPERQPHAPDRYTTRPFPAYAHRPGRTPHPLTDPRDHSYAHAALALEGSCMVPLNPAQWHGCTQYLYGIDLHNHGYWWEAHEEWESLWRGAPEGSDHARLLRALIQSCAMWLKLESGERDGVQRLLGRARPLVAALPRTGTVLGVEAAAWWTGVEAECVRCLAGGAPKGPCPPRIVVNVRTTSG